MKSEKTTLNRLQSNPLLTWKSFALPVLALLSITSMSAQRVTLLNDSFTNALRVASPSGVFTGVDRDGLAPLTNDYTIAYNNSASQSRTDAVAPKVVSSGGINGNSLSIGSGAVAVSLSTYFAPAMLDAGDSISVSLNIRSSVAPSVLATSFRIGLFDSNGGGNLVQNTTFIDSVFTDDRGYAAYFGTGPAVTHDVRERTGNALQNIFRPADFTAIGAVVTATNSVLANTTYPVTLSITRSLDGNSITTTSSFNGVAVSATDTTALVTEFDHLAIFFSSQFGGTEWIDDVVVSYTQAPPLSPLLLAYYPFDSSFNDASGNNNNLITSSGSPGITTTPGQLILGGGALNLNQSGTQQHLSFNTPLDFDGSRAWSMAWWGKRSPLSLASQGMVAGTITTSNDFVWTPNASGVVQGLQLRDGSDFSADYDGIPDDNAFHHWAVSYNGAGQVSVWRDRVSLGTKAFSGNVRMTHVGAATYTVTNSFFGQIDELYFFDGAINAANVNALYAAQPGTMGFLLCERWNSTSFYSTNELVSDRSFYGNPDITRYDKPITTNSIYQGNFYSTRTRGWISIPETGGYRFWISARNGAQLLLSIAGTKYTKRVIAELNPELGTGHGILSDSSNLWDVYSSQMSEEIQLVAGQSYYLETLQTTGHIIRSHASIAWARPGMARAPLDLAYVQPYAPTADDADDDYLPDAWESQYGLDLLDNGRTDIARQGERGDFDGDGLSNREEYLCGTNPTNSDTDGDGASDYAEAKQFNTSPLVSDAILGSIVDSPTLANYHSSGTSGTWQMFDGGLIGSSFRGRIEWSFTVPNDGWWIIDLGGQLRGNLRQSEDLALGVSIDSRPLAEHIIHFSNGQPANLRVLSPYLQAGTHTFAVDIRNEIGRRNFQLLALNVLGAGGFDADKNGRPDWLDLMLTRDNQLSPVASESFVSPLFIEGSVRHLGGAEVNSSSLPVTALRGLGDLHWFANVPLNQTGGTSIGVSLETRHQFLTVTWTRWNAMAGQALTIRVGDSIKIGGWLTPEDEGNAVISVNGQTTNLTASGSFVQTFSQPGTYPVTVSHSGGTQATASIHVVAANFGTPATFYSDKLIWRSFPGVPANLKITADPTLAVDITLPQGTGQKAQFRPVRSGNHTLAARLPNGPIVALGNVTSIGVSDALKNDATISVGFTPDGFQIIRTPIVITNLPAGGRVVLTISRAGVTFMDGTTVKTLNASDFVEGVAIVDFRFPPNLTGGYCHYIDVYDSENRHLGRR